MDRIEFEELALKNVDPSLGPKLRRKDNPHMSLEEAKKQHVSVSQLTYPTVRPTDNLHYSTLDTINTPDVFRAFDTTPTTSTNHVTKTSPSASKGFLLLVTRLSIDRPVYDYTFVPLFPVYRIFCSHRC